MILAEGKIIIPEFNNKTSFIEENSENQRIIQSTSCSQQDQLRLILQANEIVDLKANLKNNLYAISADWWRNWCDYVNTKFFDPQISIFGNIYLHELEDSDSDYHITISESEISFVNMKDEIEKEPVQVFLLTIIL